MLQTYNCDRQAGPKKKVMPAEKQLYRPDYVRQHYVHYSSVTGLSELSESEFAQACREKRFIVRDFKWDATQASKSAMAREQLQVEVDGMKSALMRWCKTHVWWQNGRM